MPKARQKLRFPTLITPCARLLAAWCRTLFDRRHRLAFVFLISWATPGFVVIRQLEAAEPTAQTPSQVEFGEIAQEANWSVATTVAVERILSLGAAKTKEEVLLRLLQHQDNQVRREALESVSRSESTSETGRRQIVRQIREMAEADRDPLCQAKAKIVLAEIGNPIRNGKTEPLPAATNQRGSLRLKPGAPLTDPQLANPVDADPSPRNQISNAHLKMVVPELFQRNARGDAEKALLRSSQVEPATFNDRSFLPSPTPQELAFPEIDDSSSIDAQLGLNGLLDPRVIDRPLAEPNEIFTEPVQDDVWPAYPLDAPLGFTGRSGILPIDAQEDGHFIPMPDRWRSGYPEWDRYDRGHPPGEDYPYQEGRWWDPYNLNVLKGDYPIIGQHTFLRLTGQLDTLQEFRQLPTGTTAFESTVKAGKQQFFGDPNQYFTTNFLRLSVDLFHGNTSFKPIDWNVHVTPVLNLNYLDTNELGVVNPNVTNGTTRYDKYFTLQEYFVEAKLKDTSADYDFTSVRAGSQQFTSDFRGFIFSDTNRAIRLFGTRLANRDQFNVAIFRQAEKDTNSQLNTLKNRDQTVFIANYYRQDFVFPGYTAELSVHYNNDGPSIQYDENEFLARPDPVGVASPHRVRSVYLGMAGDGHFGRINVTNAFYWVVGRDTLNPIAGNAQNINGQMAAAEVSYDRDWVRFRASVFYASGDRNPYDHTARGFDSILDNPNFAGGQFSYWQRQQIDLFGVGLTNRMSLVPDLRTSKFEGQSNYVNPGLQLLNLGADFELTPKSRLITNANYLQFDSAKVLEAFTFQNNISRTIGVDLSVGLEYRPLLNDNIVMTGGYACLIPGNGFKDLFGTTSPFATSNASSRTIDFLSAAFMQLVLQF